MGESEGSQDHGSAETAKAVSGDGTSPSPTTSPKTIPGINSTKTETEAADKTKKSTDTPAETAAEEKDKSDDSNSDNANNNNNNDSDGGNGATTTAAPWPWGATTRPLTKVSAIPRAGVQANSELSRATERNILKCEKH
jgi:hypothetical protein